jgi:hypothetical protein
MDKSPDKYKFPCPACSECFTTKQNLRRHITRKHKEMVWESVVESPPMTVNELIETNSLVSIILDDRGVPDIVSVNYQSDTENEPIPDDKYLTTLVRECDKYQHLFPAIRRQMKWDENNSNVDLNYHLRKHNHKMTYLLVDIRDVKLPI